jgi:hypothetical protein
MAGLERPDLDGLTAYLDDLGRRLRGPRRLKADLLAEARGSLIDAVCAREERGVPADVAQRDALAEFGPVEAVAPDYQTELAVAQGRRTVLLIFGVFFTQIFLWDDAPSVWPVTVVKWSGGLVILLAVAALIGSRRAGRRLGLLTGIFGYAVVAVFVAMGVVLTSLRYGTHLLGLSGIARTLVFLMLPLAAIAFSAQRSLLAARVR